MLLGGPKQTNNTKILSACEWETHCTRASLGITGGWAAESILTLFAKSGKIETGNWCKKYHFYFYLFYFIETGSHCVAKAAPTLLSQHDSPCYWPAIPPSKTEGGKPGMDLKEGGFGC